MNFESTNINLYDYFNSDILEDFEYQKELEQHLNELENVLIEPSVEQISKTNQNEIEDQDFKVDQNEIDEQTSKINQNEIDDQESKVNQNEIDEPSKINQNEIKKQSSKVKQKENKKQASKKNQNKIKKQASESINDTIKDTLKDTLEDTPKDTIENTPKDIPKDSINEQISKPNQKKDYIKKYIDYKPNENEIKYLNTLPTNTYVEGNYMIDSELKIKNNDNNNQMFTILENKKIQLKEANQIIQSSTGYYNISNTESYEIEPISDKKNLDFVAEINHLLNPLSTYLNYQYSKSELIYKNPNLIDCLHKNLQQSGDHTPSELTDLFARFGETLAMLIKTHKNNSLRITSKTNYKNKNNLWIDEKLNKKFNVIKLPKHLTNIIYHINYYFNQIKDKLKFNEKTGFYNITYENNEYPLICRHTYLSLIGKSQYEISTLCCVNSQCKYCGDSMIDYYYDDESDIPNSVPVLVYKLIDLSESSNDDDMFRNIFIKCTSVISKFVNKTDENYENKASAIVSIYIYKIIKEAIKQNQISEYSKKVISLIKLITDYCVLVEWDNQKIETLLNNENLFTDISSVTDLLFKDQKNNKVEDNIEYIFKNFSSNELKQFKKDNKLANFNDTLLNLILDNTDFKFINELIKTIELLSNVINENEIIFSTENNTLDLFEKLIKYYCPENFIHDWNDKKCKHCGVLKNFENTPQIYEKYKLSFNNNFILSSENKLQKFKVTELNNEDITKKINSIKENEIKEHIIKRLNISEDEYKIIDQRMFEVMPYIQSYILNELTISKDYFEKLTEKDILRLYIYLDKTSDNNMIEIFKYCLLKPTFYFKKQNSTNLYEDNDDD